VRTFKLPAGDPNLANEAEPNKNGGLSPAVRGCRKVGPGSAAQRFALPRARHTRLVVEEAPQLPASARMLHPRVKPEGMASLVVKEGAKLTATRGVFEFSQSLRLDLADAFARHRELLADLFQRVVGVHADAEPHAQHAFLARRQ
jgi:hypothetical protein